MKKILKKTRVGWVYLLGITLMFGFSALALKEGDLSALSAGSQTVSQSSNQNEDKNDTSEKPSTATTKPVVTQTQNKDSQKVSAPQKTQNIVVQTSNTQQGQPTVETVIPAKKDTVEMDITGLGKYTVEVRAGDTAFDALKRAASQNGLPIRYKIYSFGMMVTGIGAKESQGTYYWGLYYNGSYSMVGSSDLLIKDKDIIEWRYESWL